MAASDPVWDQQGKQLYYLSERSGDFNVWQRDLASGQDRQLTHFKGHPVRGLSASRQGIWSGPGRGALPPRCRQRHPAQARHPAAVRQGAGRAELAARPRRRGHRPPGRGRGDPGQPRDLYAVDTRRERVRQLTRHPSEQSAPRYLDKEQELIYLSEQEGRRRCTASRRGSRTLFSDPGTLTEEKLLAIPGAAISVPTSPRRQAARLRGGRPSRAPAGSGQRSASWSPPSSIPPVTRWSWPLPPIHATWR